jgi:hypothetical protein
MRNLTCIIAMCLLLLVGVFGTKAVAQDTKVDWFSLASGGGRLSGPGTGMTVAVGEGFVGESKGQNTVLTSGFLSGTLTSGPADGVSDQPKMPKVFLLYQNYPNPFNPSTTIQYGLPHKSLVSLMVFNALGQLVSQLVSGEQEAGYHEVRFEGAPLASGVYFYRLQAGDFVQTRKLLLVR